MCGLKVNCSEFVKVISHGEEHRDIRALIYDIRRLKWMYAALIMLARSFNVLPELLWDMSLESWYYSLMFNLAKLRVWCWLCFLSRIFLLDVSTCICIVSRIDQWNSYFRKSFGSNLRYVIWSQFVIWE